MSEGSSSNKDFRETLYTIDSRGRRKWVYSSVVDGWYLRRRTIVAYLLMAVYLLMPWIEINGRQAVFLDITSRKFVIFGAEFWATDTTFLFLVFSGLALCLFIFTSLFGRVWCGWACPETVFLEFLFRPIERLIEGNSSARERLDKSAWTANKIARKSLKYGIFTVLSWILASTFLAYFWGRETLLGMMAGSPLENLVPFSLTVFMMFLMLFQFGWFREQFCTVLCPYARFQSVLMDSKSVTVGYDVTRGEPRGKLGSNGAGDCIDCKLCVKVCPTGIDIRNGLQLECVACAACVDACNSVMTKIEKPLGLIRYDSEDRLAGRNHRWIRPRLILYSVLAVIYFSALTYKFSTRQLVDVQILRGARDVAFRLISPEVVSNHLTIKISNKDNVSHLYTFTVNGIDGAEIITPVSPLSVSSGEIKEAPIFINFPRSSLVNGKAAVDVIVQEQNGIEVVSKVSLIGQ